jgi:hypothetical protein
MDASSSKTMPMEVIQPIMSTVGKTAQIEICKLHASHGGK